MSEYTPDAWVVVEFSGTKVPQTYRRVLAGWYGGFTRGDSWRMSSGITGERDCGDHWEFTNESGSVYICWKAAERYTSQTRNVFASYAKDNGTDISIQRVPYDSAELDNKSTTC